MESTPKSIRTDKIRERILLVKGVDSIDDFHVWAIAGDKYILSAHITLKK
jgi:Co/Zn/Cd efflux system component